jgi:hypothetical protein
LVLLEDRLREFDPERETWREIRTAGSSRIAPFRAMCPGSVGEFYVTGEHGLAKLQLSGDGGLVEWREANGDADRLRHFDYPMPGAGELFAQAVATRDRRHVIVRWSGRKLESVYAADADDLRGWRGGDGSTWIAEGSAIFRLRNGRKYRVERTGVLTGTIFDVYSEAGNAFWVATSEGLTRFTPSLWRRPAGTEEFDLPVSSITEDRQGRLWMSATDCVLERSGDRWTRHELPAGYHTHTIQTNSLAWLPDGRVLVKVVRVDRADAVLAMDTKGGRFTVFSHPDGRLITLLARRPAAVWKFTMARASERSSNWVVNGRGRIFERCWSEGRERSGWVVRPAAVCFGTVSSQIRSCARKGTRRQEPSFSVLFRAANCWPGAATGF